MLLFAPFYDPSSEKLEGHVAFGLFVSLCVMEWVFAGWGVCQWGCVQRCGWLAGSVHSIGHFFETLNGECWSFEILNRLIADHG